MSLPLTPRIPLCGNEPAPHATFQSRKTCRASLVLMGFALLGATLSGCGNDAKPAEAEVVTPKGSTKTALTGTRIEVAIVEPSAGGLTIRVPGEVKGSRDALLSSALGGYIESVSVKEGDRVKKGAVLARVDSQTHSTRLVRAQLEKKAAERERDRAVSLKGTIPDAEIDSAEDRVATAGAALRELQVNVTRSVINAPFSGIIVRVDAEVGEVAAPGSPLFRLVQATPVHVSVALSDRDMAITKKGMSATVDLEARSGLFEGEVIRLSHAADLKTRSFEAVIEVENKDELLLPGMIAQVSLTSAPKTRAADAVADKLFISQDWLVTQPSGVGVFIEKDGKAAWRPVELGGVMRRQVEVTAGLNVGDSLIIVGHRSLADGDPVLVHRRGICCVDGRATFAEGAQKPAPKTALEPSK